MKTYILFLQAQDEVIGILKAEKIDLALLEAQYGFVTPKKVLEALQRDAIQTKAEQWQEDIYEKPMGEVCITDILPQISQKSIVKISLIAEKESKRVLGLKSNIEMGSIIKAGC